MSNTDKIKSAEEIARQYTYPQKPSGDINQISIKYAKIAINEASRQAVEVALKDVAKHVNSVMPIMSIMSRKEEIFKKLGI